MLRASRRRSRGDAVSEAPLLGQRRCEGVRFSSRQCPECFALLDLPEARADDSALQECETCGSEAPLLGDESISTKSTPAASDQVPLAPEAGARWPGVSTFRVTQDRSGGAALGIAVDFHDGSAVLIEEVGEGLFKLWNDRNEDAEVRSGDYLVEGNGISGNSRLICVECAETNLLEIVVLRRGPMF
ncbi:unnamed protein product [Prorocentrum cordatum]|uniref:Zinc ribbon domain-containing protein n=1 Tax=Prorocentrum cordatum TaxID=2364126 RepID=A0ABN9W4A4_9DINO|nr:unnamed protein product [Polarella glacialis]